MTREPDMTATYLGTHTWTYAKLDEERPVQSVPKHNVCGRCGRRAHKIAVRRADGTVVGFCPRCWETPNPYAPHMREGTVLYDLRKDRA